MSGKAARCPCCQQTIPKGLGLVISLDANTAAARGQCVRLPPDKAVIAYALAQAAPGAVTYEKLIDAVWGYDSPLTALNILKSHVWQVRRALEPLRYGVVAVWKHGYRLIDCDDVHPVDINLSLTNGKTTVRKMTVT
jgi:DNA-binding response OmpR family regulator